jgi:type III restriction enzyme
MRKYMNINLLPYQEKAVDQLIKRMKVLLSSPGTGKICVFQSPTGSGKTVIIAKFIEEIIKDLAEVDMCFVWISIGKGNLHIQSRDSLKSIFGGFPRCVLAEDDFTGGRQVISRNEVVVINWEKLRSKSNETGEWLNILMRDGEIVNFRQVLANTRDKRKVILIIDESHVGKGSERTIELVSEVFSPNVSLEMSATPDKESIPSRQAEDEGRGAYYCVEPKDVIDQGMIKKEIIINENLEDISESEQNSQDVVLEATYQKRLTLAEDFGKLKVNINPLVLIQIPTAEAGKAKIEAIKKFLQTKKLSEETGELAIWLTEKKSEDIDEIARPNNKIQFLIFKQAIDTGWDCPRAHILVKFRESHSETFEIQTVGRIMRMPEQKHYINDNLNRGYIYTNVQSIIVKKEDYNPNIIKHLKSSRNSCYSGLGLKSFYKTRASYGDITAKFWGTFERVAGARLAIVGDFTFYKQNIVKLTDAGYVFTPDSFQQDIIADTAIDSTQIDTLSGEIKPESTVRLSVSGNDLYDTFNQVIKDNIGSFAPKRSLPIVREVIYKWFRKYFGSKAWPEEIITIQRIFLHDKNRSTFISILSEATENYKVVKEAEVRERVIERIYDFEISEECFYNQNTDVRVKVKKYVYDPCYLNADRSNPEENFEELLESDHKAITWWWKNGDNQDDYLGIKYDYEGGIHTFYPDYIIQLADGRIGIFEIKDCGDRDGSTLTKAKAERFQEYLAEEGKRKKKVFGGIVICVNNQWKINRKKTYNWEICLRGDWSDWEELKLS